LWRHTQRDQEKFQQLIQPNDPLSKGVKNLPANSVLSVHMIIAAIMYIVTRQESQERSKEKQERSTEKQSIMLAVYLY